MKKAKKTKVSPARSAQMALIRAKNTKPELVVRSFLHKAGLRYRLHDKALPGKPDLVFPSRRIALFVHGCFWHRHSAPSCKLARLPKSRLDFWLPKLQGNRERDTRTRNILKKMGWKQIAFWECETKNIQKLQALANKIARSSKTASPKNQH